MDTQALDRWAHAELEKARSDSRRERLKRLITDMHKHPHSNALPVGSTQRAIAERNERKVMQQAMGMGYVPPEKEIQELGLHLGLDMALGL